MRSLLYLSFSWTASEIKLQPKAVSDISRRIDPVISHVSHSCTYFINVSNSILVGGNWNLFDISIFAPGQQWDQMKSQTFYLRKDSSYLTCVLFSILKRFQQCLRLALRQQNPKWDLFDISVVAPGWVPDILHEKDPSYLTYVSSRSFRRDLNNVVRE